MGSLPDGAEAVNRNEIAPFNSCSEPDFLRRGYYLDVTFRCFTCGVEKTWTAKQQKLWYEKEKGYVWATARYCAQCRKKRRGLPQKAPSTPAKIAKDPARNCARLRRLGALPPTPESRLEVAHFLETGIQPVQSVAAEVLAVWGGRESVEALRDWLPQILTGDWHAIQSKAGKLLGSCVEKKDEEWVVAVFESLKDKHARYWMLPMFEPFSQTQRLYKVLRRESESPAPAERMRALFFLSLLMVKQREFVFKMLAFDEDPAVADLASKLAKDPDSSWPAHRVIWQWVLNREK